MIVTTSFSEILIFNLLFWYRSAMIEGKQSVSKYLKYSPDDLERMLNDLFEGKSRQEPRARQEARPPGR